MEWEFAELGPNSRTANSAELNGASVECWSKISVLDSGWIVEDEQAGQSEVIMATSTTEEPDIKRVGWKRIL